MMGDGQKIRWAILGTGVVSRKFVLGLKPLAGQMSVVAVASRSAEKARRFAADLGIATVAPGYAEAAARPDVDAVYIATPPSEHEVNALMAIAAGKAVLIEKPFAFDASAARRIADAARAAGVFCMEAMWTRFLPIHAELRDCLARGQLGEIRSLQGSFMGTDLVDPGVSLFDPARGGGALMHRGVYPLSLARSLLGPIREVSALGRLGTTGVDEDCSLVLRHEGGAISTITASLRAPGPNRLVLSGTQGMLQLAPPIFRPSWGRLDPATPRKASGTAGGGRLEGLRESGLAQRANQLMPEMLRQLLGKGRRLSRPYGGNGYHYEAAEVALRMRQGETESPLMPLEESIEIMAVIDEARAQFR